MVMALINIYGLDIKYSGRGYAVHASNFQCEVNVTGQAFEAPTLLGPATVDLGGLTGDCDVSAAGFNLDMKNIIVYAEWTKRTTDDTLSQAFGDTEAFYATFGYRFGKWMPHITFASIEGEASLVGLNDGTDSGVADVGFAYPGGGGLTTLNFPAPTQTSITAGLRYEVNDSAALKVEYQVIDVEQDDLVADTNHAFNYGLFNTNFTKFGPQENIGILSVALDVIF
jgi:hypothetical protein